MEFLHCQRCYHLPQLYSDTRRYFITGCGRLFCQTCIHALNGKCGNCSGECRVTEVNAQASADIKSYFTNPLALLKDAMKKPFQIMQFQINLQKEYFRVIKRIIDSVKTIKSENENLKNEIRRLQQGNESLKLKVNQLQETININETSHVGGVDALANLFRDSSQRPNAQVHPITLQNNVYQQPQQRNLTAEIVTHRAPAPFSPLSTGSAFGSSDSSPQRFIGLPRSQNSLFGGDFPPGFNQQQASLSLSPSSSLFRTPAITPQLNSQLHSQYASSTQSSGLSARPNNNNVLNLQPGYGTGSNKTPELINRLRNLKCQTTPNPGSHFRFTPHS